MSNLESNIEGDQQSASNVASLPTDPAKCLTDLDDDSLMHIFEHLSAINLCAIKLTSSRFAPLADRIYSKRSETCQIAPYMPRTEIILFGSYIKKMSFTNFQDETNISIRHFAYLQKRFLSNLIEAEFHQCKFTVDNNLADASNNRLIPTVEKLTIERCEIRDDLFIHLPIGPKLQYLDVMNAGAVLNIHHYIELIPNVKTLLISLMEDHNLFNEIFVELAHLERLVICLDELFDDNFFGEHLQQLSTLKLFEYSFPVLWNTFVYDIENSPNAHLRIVPEYQKNLRDYLYFEVD